MITSSRSRILDTDYAKVTTEMSRSQIIAQASIAMLAQANQSAQSVLWPCSSKRYISKRYSDSVIWPSGRSPLRGHAKGHRKRWLFFVIAWPTGRGNP